MRIHPVSLLMAIGLSVLPPGGFQAQDSQDSTAPNPILEVVAQDLDRLLRRIRDDGPTSDLGQSLATNLQVAALSIDDSVFGQLLDQTIAVHGSADGPAAHLLTSRHLERELQARGLGGVRVPLLSMNDAREAVSDLRGNGLSIVFDDAASMLREASAPGAAPRRNATADEDPEKCLRSCRAALRSAERLWKSRLSSAPWTRGGPPACPPRLPRSPRTRTRRERLQQMPVKREASSSSRLRRKGACNGNQDVAQVADAGGCLRLRGLHVRRRGDQAVPRLWADRSRRGLPVAPVLGGRGHRMALWLLYRAGPHEIREATLAYRYGGVTLATLTIVGVAAL